MKMALIVAAVLLAVLHQDFWWWDAAEPLVFGFIPIGLAYHALYSLLAAGLWASAVKFAWPTHIEEFAELPAEETNQ